jgi:hypothetical protein
MRVVSLVPSLTEALLESGVEVVGRTRFCVHPAEAVAGIPIVGGTKDADWAECAALRPDLVVMDREENTREMADACPLPWTAVHITSVESVGPELERLAREVSSCRLEELAAGWREVAEREALLLPGWSEIPGAWSYLPGEPDRPDGKNFSRLEYVIWRKPWMAIGPGTFIHSMLGRVGFGEVRSKHASRYQELSEADMNRRDTFYLFSSEPYPFAEKKKLLTAMGVAGAIVDGESYSWYGPRSYRFLEELYRA